MAVKVDKKDEFWKELKGEHSDTYSGTDSSSEDESNKSSDSAA